MRDFIEIGSAPADEDCVQVRSDRPYITDMIKECHRFRDLIRKKLGTEPNGAELVIKANTHDFGTYYEVVCYYDESKKESLNYALKCESEAPKGWED